MVNGRQKKAKLACLLAVRKNEWMDVKCELKVLFGFESTNSMFVVVCIVVVACCFCFFNSIIALSLLGLPAIFTHVHVRALLWICSQVYLGGISLTSPFVWTLHRSYIHTWLHKNKRIENKRVRGQ